FLCAASSGAGCGPQSFAEHGAALARDPAIAVSRYNAFACTTCHAERSATAGTTIYPGAPLAGATARPSWWNGQVLDLNEAVDACFGHSMRGERLDPNSDTAQALLAYMTELNTTATPAERAAVPFTIPATTTDIAPGDATRGADVYQRACGNCHGAIHTGAGR